MNLTRNGLIVLISVIFVAGAGTAYAGIVLPMITLAGNVQVDGNLNVDGTIAGVVPVMPIQVPRDNSLTLIDPPLSVRFGTDTSITIAEDGLPVISSTSPANGALMIVKCGNTSCSSGNIISTPDNDASIGSFTSITFGIDGLPLVSYYDNTNDQLKVLKCGNAACSSGNTITPIDSIISHPSQKTSITIGTDGLPVISYFDATNFKLNVAKCGDASCTAAGGFTITPVDTGGQHSSITISTDGLPIISYVHSFDQEVRVAKCGNTSCTVAGGFTITVVDPTPASVTGGTTITLGEDGLPIISYNHFGTSHELRVLKCGNAACSSGNTITIIDSSPTNTSLGKWSSISIAPDGLPVISYHSGGTTLDTSLKVVKCGNTACSTGNTITTVDSGNFIGRHTSITIGTDGLPIISYGGESEELKVAKCGNSLCLPFWTRR